MVTTGDHWWWAETREQINKLKNGGEKIFYLFDFDSKKRFKGQFCRPTFLPLFTHRHDLLISLSCCTNYQTSYWDTKFFLRLVHKYHFYISITKLNQSLDLFIQHFRSYLAKQSKSGKERETLKVWKRLKWRRFRQKVTKLKPIWLPLKGLRPEPIQLVIIIISNKWA